jgi:hypothetical protein
MRSDVVIRFEPETLEIEEAVGPFVAISMLVLF